MQLNAHAPLLHTATAFDTGRHTVPHMPQFAVSLWKFAHTPLAAQYVVPDGHELTQLELPAAPAQCVPAAQVVPQVPQLVFVVVDVSQPLATLPSQLAQPASHAAMPHAPAVHAAVACGMEHAVPHAPQAVTVVLRFVSQPSAAVELQSA